jgi:hypothetical protein
MTRWTRPENLEAMFGAAAELPGAATVTAAITRPVIEAAEAAVEIAVEAEASAMEAVEAEMAAAEAVMDAPVLDAPVGGEAAPIGPAVAELARKPRAKKGEPKAE